MCDEEVSRPFELDVRICLAEHVEGARFCRVELLDLCVNVMPIPQALPQAIGQLPIGKSVMRQMEVSAAGNLPEPRIFPKDTVKNNFPACLRCSILATA